MNFKDYYEILNMPPNAEMKVLQQTFHQLARKLHPDVNLSIKEVEEKFKTVEDAYQHLQ